MAYPQDSRHAPGNAFFDAGYAFHDTLVDDHVLDLCVGAAIGVDCDAFMNR